MPIGMGSLLLASWLEVCTGSPGRDPIGPNRLLENPCKPEIRLSCLSSTGLPRNPQYHLRLVNMQRTRHVKYRAAQKPTVPSQACKHAENQACPAQVLSHKHARKKCLQGNSLDKDTENSLDMLIWIEQNQ